MGCTLCILICIFSSCQGALMMSDVIDLAKSCIKLEEVNGTEEDYTDLLMGYLPNTRTGMCMLRCMATHVGILVNDTYDMRGTFMFFRTHFPENPYSKNMERGVRFCAKVVIKRQTPEMDACQYAHMVAACVKRRIKYVPGCRAAFYNPFKWKNPFKKGTVRPAKKYFEVDKKYQQHKIEFEFITRPTRKYTLDDVQGVLESESEQEAKYWVPPRERKGKRNRDKKVERGKGKGKGKRKGKGKKSKEESESEELDSWDESTKERRHQKKLFRI